MEAAPPGSASVVGPGDSSTDETDRHGVSAIDAEMHPGATPSAVAASRRPDQPPPESGEGGRSEDPEGPPFGPITRMVIITATVGVLALALLLRFWTKSDLWLDEALTVNIARQPLHQLPSLLHRDGAPPLYYALLHVWMGWFGTSDLAVRSLSGLFGVITVPVVWLAGRRLGSRTIAWAAMLLVATSPFAVRYDTEARMYSLVALLSVLGFLALDRSLRKPRPGNLIAVGAVAGLLLYTHYWSVFLLGTVLLWLAFQAWRGREAWRLGARRSLVAIAVGCLTFLPWVPTFLFQSKHTGTPWAVPASFVAMVNAISSFAGGDTGGGRALGILFFGLAGLGLFGVATDRFHIDLDIRTRPLGRPVGVVVAGTLTAAILGGLIFNSTFDARYASVVFVPLILLVAIGIQAFRDRRVRLGVLAVAVVAGLASAIPNVTTNRTQAGQIAAQIARQGRPGDLVVYCPDQLGPATDRLLPSGRYQQTTFPRGTGPAFVNWIDYSAVAAAADPVAFAQRVETQAARGGHQIFVVWAPQYQAFGLKCEGLIQTLQADPDYHVTSTVTGDAKRFYQPMWMVQLAPTNP